ncbi:MAG: hypothetical protein NT040_09935 [Bacteroidetes bacterium]|nr:hypothetical protein [Bacteroidota bacterium]
MKTTKRYMVKPEKIHSLQDLSLEKERLRLEIMKTEQNIHAGYRDILHALTFKNLATSMIQDISATSSVLTKAISIGKSFMTRRKKKKQDKLKEISDDL